jgi:hypothetical protein
MVKSRVFLKVFVVAETPLKDKSLLCSPKTLIFRTLATPTQTNRK